ncbi:DUF72 domain-containing protein [Polaromonas eurypsychrophila]|uniref:DUF72 domain-containing protein n=1 Tax=Polaromonas eurypsychrophila TaxID=1614635 RepID=A0A916WDH9_9BURK|nr:DUF72 domain-containing protein [Polaromonas eurypsychrophila]GGA89780.1 hypothetical protein GCM10011496_08250 [Polaromonas eurypsychrophila]
MKKSSSSASGIRVGIGGWTYAPWRDNFYPAKLPHSQELGYASRQLSAIEVNGTYYSSFKPPTFAKWRDETPDDFVLSLKAIRFTTNRRVLAEAGESIQRFVDSGISELGHKLGPIVWQFMPAKVFDAEDFGAFLALLPKTTDGLTLRHVLDVRHPSFMTPDFLKLARKYQCATVFTDSPDFPSFADLTSDFVYARLMRSDAKLKTGYAPKALDAWAAAAQSWAQGSEPENLPRLEPAKAKVPPRDVFVFFINGAKEKAPAAAMALLQRLGFKPPE